MPPHSVCPFYVVCANKTERDCSFFVGGHLPSVSSILLASWGGDLHSAGQGHSPLYELVVLQRKKRRKKKEGQGRTRKEEGEDEVEEGRRRWKEEEAEGGGRR